MPQDQNKLIDLISLSLVLDEGQKQSLTVQLPSLSGDQLGALMRVLESEAAERDTLLAERLHNDPSAADRYTDALARLRRQAFEQAEALEAEASSLSPLNQP